MGALNLKDNTLSPTNGLPTLAHNYSSYYDKTKPQSYHIIPIRGTDDFVISAQYSGISDTKIVYNSFMLSTINNLSEPVQKTSDISMKITYTLTLIGDVEEGDS